MRCASLVKLYRAWPRLSADPDAYLWRIMVNTHRSWWRARWRRETPADRLPDRTQGEDIADHPYTGSGAVYPPGKPWTKFPAATFPGPRYQ